MAERPKRSSARYDPYNEPQPAKKVTRVPKPGRAPRQLVQPNDSAPITSINMPVGGEAGVCRNNKLNTLIYDYGAESWVYNTYFAHLEYTQMLWFFYDDPYSEPNENTPMISQLTEANSHKIVIIPKYRFTDNSKHDVLGVRVPTDNSKGYTDYKIKWAPKTCDSDELPLFFYIEEYQGPGLPMRKRWGDIASNLPSNSQFGSKKKSNLKVLNRDIAYLKR